MTSTNHQKNSVFMRNKLDTLALIARIAALVNAGIAQLVEHNLAKVGVASSNLVSRSKFFNSPDFLRGYGFFV